MKKYVIVCICMLMLLVPLVHAAPPVTQTFTGDVGLTIENPLVTFLKQNRDVTSHLHVYNSSSGFPMTNATTSCELNIYNETGGQIFSELYPYSASKDLWELNISGGNFSNLDRYGFVIHCNTSAIGGFVKGRVTITQDGEEPRDNIDVIIILSAIGILFIIIGLILLWIKRKE